MRRQPTSLHPPSLPHHRRLTHLSSTFLVPFSFGVLVSDWDGVNEYEQLRATMYNYDMNLVGFAADIYGIDRHNVSDINERIALATFWRSNGTLFAERIQAAVDLVRTLPQVNSDQIALAGYCFGGTGVLLYGLQGLNDVQAIVSFHGGLTGLPLPNTWVTPPLLVLSGGADDTSTDVMALETTLNSVNATWEITRYSDVEHAFTVFDDERYNEWADRRSWESTRTFLENVFGIKPYETGSPPETVSVEAVPYTDVDGTRLQGYLAVPNSSSWIAPHPAVVILPYVVCAQCCVTQQCRLLRRCVLLYRLSLSLSHTHTLFYVLQRLGRRQPVRAAARLDVVRPRIRGLCG